MFIKHVEPDLTCSIGRYGEIALKSVCLNQLIRKEFTVSFRKNN